jgi:AcrR family transcriptional regulator
MESPVTLLRASKKQQTRDRILANAISLFRQRGIRTTRMSEIASASEVSPATLFNYFATKGQLAEAWVRGEVESSLENAAIEAMDRDRSLRSAIRGACRVLAAAAATQPVRRREAWREAGRARSQPATDLTRFLAKLGAEQESERVRGDLTQQGLAEMLIDAIESGLISGLAAAAEDPSGELEDQLSRKIRERVDLVLDGARKRNERVRAARPGGGPQ